MTWINDILVIIVENEGVCSSSSLKTLKIFYLKYKYKRKTLPNVQHLTLLDKIRSIQSIISDQSEFLGINYFLMLKCQKRDILKNRNIR